ncbi:hypothetical protein JCM8547_007132 [Rhodosporidiobolus lusitaniae]
MPTLLHLAVAAYRTPSAVHRLSPLVPGGRSRRACLVSVDKPKQHLEILSAFHALRRQVEDDPSPPRWIAHLEPKARWSCFLNIAVYRLELYLNTVLKWHSADSINPTTLRQEPSASDCRDWLGWTGTSYDPLVHFQVTIGATLSDAKPASHIIIPWITVTGTGYAQRGFSFLAPSGHTWPHESRGVFKLAKDIAPCLSYSSAHIAGTIDAVDELSLSTDYTKRSTFIQTALGVKYSSSFYQNAQYVASMMKWTRDGAEKFLKDALGKKRQPGINKILSCYTRGEAFSLDLAMAALRQGTFIEKVHDLGWLHPDCFKEDDSLLKRSVARYHGFIDLLSSTASMFCVPTLDIDLA